LEKIKHGFKTLAECGGIRGVDDTSSLLCLINLTMGIVEQHYFIRFNKEIRADLSMWLHFLDNSNGKSLLAQ
jgi:hypothetical protein